MSLFFFIFFSLFFHQSILAQEATVTPDPKAKEIREMVTELAQKKFNEILNKDSTSLTTPKSLIGNITQINESQIVINYKNESKTITFTDETVFIDIKRNKTKIENIKVGQDILAMGYFNQYGNFEAKRMVITDLKTIENKNEIILGKIVDISQSSPVFSLTSIKNKENTYQIKTDSKTEILDKDNNKLTIDKLKAGQKIIVIIQPDPKIAKTFYVSKIITLDTSTVTNN